MRIGFTGTQAGMTGKQREQVKELLDYKKPEVCIHGDCIGADRDFHELARTVGAKVEIHPPTNSSKRAFCSGDVEYQPLPYLERNHNIVDSSDFIIATPKSNYEELRSGTWATIRYARKKHKRCVVIYP